MIKQYTKGEAKQLSKNFKSTEFDCKCRRNDCKETLVDLDGIECLQKAREKVGKPITVNSGFRCAVHNKNVGGASNSKHLKGIAFDLRCPDGVSLNDFAIICEQAGFHGVLRYDGEGFVHCDMRDGVYYGVTQNGGKNFKKVETFNPNPPQKTVEVTLPILKKGSMSEVVKTLQLLLKSKGFKGENGKDLTVDGDFGKNTEFAVKKLQGSCNLTSDGIVGKNTWKRMLGV